MESSWRPLMVSRPRLQTRAPLHTVPHQLPIRSGGASSSRSLCSSRARECELDVGDPWDVLRATSTLVAASAFVSFHYARRSRRQRGHARGICRLAAAEHATASGDPPPPSASVGMDIGTTNSAVALLRPDGRFALVPPEGAPPGRFTMPSVVAYNHMGRAIAGFPALRVKHDGVRQVVFRSTKRVLGRTYEDAHRAQIDPNAFGADPSGKRFELVRMLMPGGRFCITPEEVLAEIIKSLKKRAELYMKQPVDRVVIGVPARFDRNQRAAMEMAARLGGFRAVQLHPEPELALRSYGMRLNADMANDNSFEAEPEFLMQPDENEAPQEPTQRHVLVADLGGGTFDVSVVRHLVEINELHMLYTSGDNRLGGDDFDHELCKWAEQGLAKHLSSEKVQLWPLNKQNRQRLRLACRKAKERLSSVEKTEVEFAGGKLPITRTEMAAICIDPLQRMLQPIRMAAHASNVKLPWETLATNAMEAAQKAGKNPTASSDREEQIQKLKRQLGATDLSTDEAAIDSVLCIGAATWSPAVRELLKLITASEPSTSQVDPETAVALGAAVVSAVIDSKIPDLQVHSSWRLAWGEYFMNKVEEHREQEPLGGEEEEDISAPGAIFAPQVAMPDIRG